MGDSAYSFSLTTFSRTGKLLQIEYALNAVANGRTALGIAAVDGVVIATDKKFGSPLVDTGSVRKVEKITDSSGFVYAGVGPDYRVLGMCVFFIIVVVVVYLLLILLFYNLIYIIQWIIPRERETVSFGGLYSSGNAVAVIL